MRKAPIFGALALAAAVALPSAAQQHAHPGAMQGQDSAMTHMQMMHGGMMMQGGSMGMMEAMPPGPGMILGAAEELSLTPDQTERLRTLRDEMQAAHQQQMQAARAAHAAAATVLGSEVPDLDRYEEHLRTAAEHMVAMHVAMTRNALAAREILTEEQRAALEDAVAMMRHMHGGMPGHDGMDAGMRGPGGAG